jgi:hypothetical protein
MKRAKRTEPDFKIEWLKWLDSTDGKSSTFGSAEGDYLENRLWHAFTAGWNARVSPQRVGPGRKGERDGK